MNYSFKNFQKNAIIRFLALDKYNYIKENLYKCDVSKDIDFQTRFNAFYRVRRDYNWRKKFYTYFESIKNNKSITFEEILNHMFKETGNVEASFCSKLLSTINPKMPIIDKYVLQNLNLEIKGETKEEKIKNTIDVYYKILDIENNKLKEKDIQQTITEFREYLPEYNLSDIKILDYILWNTRNNGESGEMNE